LGRSNALCAECGSLERHRTLAASQEALFADGGGKRALEAGPANRRIFGDYLRDRGWEYVSMDRWKTGNPKDPRAVGFIDVETDLCDLSMFGDDEFDLFIAQHVIEEIEDFRLALDEVRRVLGPGATALLEIPFDAGRELSEKQPPDHFGNVWNFGRDLLDELRRRFGEVEELRLSEGAYRGVVLACRVDRPGPTEAAARFAAPADPGGDPPTVAENRLPGDELFWHGRKAPGRSIEGYASWPSVEPGGMLELHVSTTPAARYRISIHRLGWYDGAGGRTVAEHPAAGDAQGAPQPSHEIAPGPEIVSCGWPVSDTIPIGRDWVSGQYVARLVLTEGELKDNIAFVPFVVRAPLERRSDVLVQMPVTTAAAYNNWGGKSLYPSSSSDGVEAVKVSFDRPIPTWHDANPNARWPFIWDFQLIRFLEREGYDVAYTTDLDTHREPWGLLGHPVLMTSGHDEYWSIEMRDGFEAARDSGSSLAFMGANTCYWQARFEDGERTMVEYRKPQRDPEPDGSLKTVRFRELVPPRPECELLGIQYQDGLDTPGMPPRDYELVESSLSDPWMEGTGFEHPASLPGLVGYEWDGLQEGAIPAGATVFFHHDDEVSNADVVRHPTAAGGLVFASGSLQFSWGLDDWGNGNADERLQRFMKNALDDLIAHGRRST
jgi:SAM-dependent methyltransferase